jgi:hypothetical protein
VLARALAIVVAIAAIAGIAGADPRIQQLITGYEREARTCKIQQGGVDKALAGAKTLVADGDDSASADAATLEASHTAMQAYCDAVGALLDLLKADPNATFKSIEKQVDEQVNKIGKLRQAGKKALDDAGPAIQRIVPKVNARVANSAQKPSEHTVPGKFPSGRAIVLR